MSRFLRFFARLTFAHTFCTTYLKENLVAVLREVLIPGKELKCAACGYVWVTIKTELPDFCANGSCRSREWNGKKGRWGRPRTRKDPENTFAPCPPRIDRSSKSTTVFGNGETVTLIVPVFPEGDEAINILIDKATLPRMGTCQIFALGISTKRYPVVVIDEPEFRNLGNALLGKDERSFYVKHRNGDHTDFRLDNLCCVPRKRNLQRRPKYGYTWKASRTIALRRSRGICEMCESKKAVHVHHEIPLGFFANPEDANNAGNLIAICLACHGEAHRILNCALLIFLAILGKKERKDIIL